MSTFSIFVNALAVPTPPTAIISTTTGAPTTDDVSNDLSSITIYLSSHSVYNGATTVSKIWQIKNLTSGGDWVDAGTIDGTYTKVFDTSTNSISIRAKIEDSNGLIGYSNVITKYYTLSLYTLEIGYYNSQAEACAGSSETGLAGFISSSPGGGDTIYNYDSVPVTGSFSFIKLF